MREAWKVDKEKQYGTCATGDEVVGEEVVVEVNDSEEVVPVEEDDEDGSRLDVSSAAKPGDESMQVVAYTSNTTPYLNHDIHSLLYVTTYYSLEELDC